VSLLKELPYIIVHRNLLSAVARMTTPVNFLSRACLHSVRRVSTFRTKALTAPDTDGPRSGRSFHTLKSAHKLLYPFTSEAPEITSTKNISGTTNKKYTSPDPFDPFDDADTLSATEREQFKRKLQATVPQRVTGSTRIGSKPPPEIPPNVSADQLETPEVMLTTLPNGVRVVSFETYAQFSTIGVFTEAGSRLETKNETGVTDLLETIAFGDNAAYTREQSFDMFQDWGGRIRMPVHQRDQLMYLMDLLRPNVSKAVHSLAQSICYPLFTDAEIEDAKMALEFKDKHRQPHERLSEAVQRSAYGADQQLGQPHYCPAEAIPLLTGDIARDYYRRQVLNNPKSMVVSGAGVEHDYLVEHVEKGFGHLQQQDSFISPLVPSIYKGGEDRQKVATEDGLTHVALSVGIGGWKSDDLVPVCVIQTLLGGGSAFSSGGPGKGMYSRLYRQVLHRYHWVESCLATQSLANEAGLWVISGATRPDKCREMVQVLAEQLARLSVDSVTDEELDRARNMLKNNVLTSLESRLIICEDLGRQICTYGHRENVAATMAKIEAVSKEDIRALAVRAMQNPPSIASVGDDLSTVPYHSELTSWFR
jgi:processing peptidase subunit alpha